ncbi:hypothetical protein J3Q64DRAFT_1173343 [Phycomyces blakesleeanus]|uniref:Uncharacterized protein n=1 Tax=Phycomyces blakesleeanus TaxID=4837 RepID=A0ABR3AWT5_PHYBL
MKKKESPKKNTPTHPYRQRQIQVHYTINRSIYPTIYQPTNQPPNPTSKQTSNQASAHAIQYNTKQYNAQSHTTPIHLLFPLVFIFLFKFIQNHFALNLISLFLELYYASISTILYKQEKYAHKMCINGLSVYTSPTLFLPHLLLLSFNMYVRAHGFQYVNTQIYTPVTQMYVYQLYA